MWGFSAEHKWIDSWDFHNSYKNIWAEAHAAFDFIF